MSSYPPPLPPQHNPQYPWQTQRPGVIVPRNRHALHILIVAVTIVVAFGVGLFVAFNRPRPKARPAESIAQKYSEVSRAFSTSNPADVAEAAAIKSALDRYTAAIRRNDASAAADCFDVDRMVREIQGLGLLTNMSRRNQADFSRGMRTALRQQLAQKHNGLRVVGVEVKGIRSLGNDDAVVFIRGTHEMIGKMKYRWWLHKSSGQWRIYDLEDLDGGIRVSNAMGMALGGSGSSPSLAPWVPHAPKLQAMLQAIASQDIPAAEKTIKDLEGVQFPAPIQSLITIVKASIAITHEKYDEAIKLCEQAESLNPDLPVSLNLRAVACNGLGQYEKAITYGQRYLELLGEDAATLGVVGQAHEALHHTDQATDCFRRGLADDPSETSNLEGLARVLPPESAGELAQAVVKCPDPKSAFADAAGQIYTSEKLSSFTAAYRKLQGEDPEWAYHEARALLLRKEHSNAMDLLKRFIGRAPAEERLRFADLLLTAALRCGRYEEAYGLHPAKPSAFSRVCGTLLARDKAVELKSFLDKHEAELGRDPWPLFYRGHLLELECDCAGAALKYEAGLRLVSSEENYTFIAAFARASYLAKQAVGAYTRTARDLQPALFDCLAENAYEHKDPETLASLIAAREKSVSTDEALDFCRIRLMFLKGDYAGIASLPTARAQKLRSGETHGAQFHELAIRSLIRLKRIDEMRKELDRLDPDSRTPMTNLLAHAAGRDAAAMQKAIADWVEDDGELTELYADRDLGPLLAAPEMEAVRKKYPKPRD